MIRLFLSLQSWVPRILLIITALLGVTNLILAGLLLDLSDAPIFSNANHRAENSFWILATDFDYWEVFYLPPMWFPFFLLLPLLGLKMVVTLFGGKEEGNYFLQHIYMILTGGLIILVSANLMVFTLFYLFSDAAKYDVAVFWKSLAILLLPPFLYAIFRQAMQKAPTQRMSLFYQYTAMLWIAFLITFMTQVAITTFNPDEFAPLPALETVVTYTLTMAILGTIETFLWMWLQPRTDEFPYELTP